MVTTELNNQLGAEKGSVRYFHTLFPGGIHQAFLIAGLPMMDSCC
jgi:sulfur relay (sulfurtransferase) DsrC/TusE family protein